VANIWGIIITCQFPNTFQYWQPKAPTFSPQLPFWGKITDELPISQNYLLNNFAIMWRIFGELLLHANSQILSNIGNFLNAHGGVRGEARFPPLKAFVRNWI
jgi:hypothetical protein